MLTRLTPSYSGYLVCLPVAEWGLGYSLWKQEDAGVLLQGEGSSGFRTQERKGKDERTRDWVPGLGDRFGMEPQSKTQIITPGLQILELLLFNHYVVFDSATPRTATR